MNYNGLRSLNYCPYTIAEDFLNNYLCVKVYEIEILVEVLFVLVEYPDVKIFIMLSNTGWPSTALIG